MREVLKPGVILLPAPPPKPGDAAHHHHPPLIPNHHVQANVPLPAERRANHLDEALRALTGIFPKICPKAASAYLELLLNLQPFEQALQLAVAHILENGFPESSNTEKASSSKPADERRDLVHLSSSSDSDDSDDQQTAEEAQEAHWYEEWCIFRLCIDFPRVGLPSLRAAVKLFRGLGPTYKAVNLQYRRTAAKKKDVELFAEGSEDASWLPKGKLKLLKCDRLSRSAPSVECPRFERDWKALQSELQKFDVFEDELCDDDGGTLPPAETLVECGCCCAESHFEELVQCADGHLFCTECLRRHLEGYIFGGSQTCGLPSCMDTNGCDKTFPWSEVRRALPLDVLSKYEQRQAEDAVARAKLAGLVYCPFCNHPWEVDPGMVVLYCLNETCKKASCIKCKEPNHYPQRCEEVEKKSETSLRRKVEELMTKALIRECISCRAELVKIEGCNKITCRCGQTMCYVCRKAILDYSHFCQHAREPGRPCKQCAGCSLWERENEAEVVKAAKQAAIQEVGAQDPGVLKRDIGPSAEVDRHNKKPRVVPFAHY